MTIALEQGSFARKNCQLNKEINSATKVSQSILSKIIQTNVRANLLTFLVN
jgi:hypothetical protein